MNRTHSGLRTSIVQRSFDSVAETLDAVISHPTLSRNGITCIEEPCVQMDGAKRERKSSFVREDHCFSLAGPMHPSG